MCPVWFRFFVIVNSDLQRELKGSKEFQDEEERVLIISNTAEEISENL